MSLGKKPRFLYHGSPNGEIEEFEPRTDTGSGKQFGPLVYASHDLTTATIFMFRFKGTMSTGRFYRIPYTIITQNRESFITNDKGGFIYYLPSDTFSSDPKRGLGQYEWASSVPVRPIKKEFYPCALDTMLANGVQVYFVDNATYAAIKNSSDHGLSILQKLESENQRRGINVRELKKPESWQKNK